MGKKHLTPPPFGLGPRGIIFRGLEVDILEIVRDNPGIDLEEITNKCKKPELARFNIDSILSKGGLEVKKDDTDSPIYYLGKYGKKYLTGKISFS